MSYRNYITAKKPLSISSGPKRVFAFAMVFMSFLGMPAATQACSRSINTIQVTPDFRIVVMHGSKPVSGIHVEVYDERAVQSGNSAMEERPVLRLVTSTDGVAEVKGLANGSYVVETAGPGRGDGVYVVIADSPGKKSQAVSLQWPYSPREEIGTRNLSGELQSNDPWRPLENVQVELWAAGFDQPLEVRNTGPQGLFQFDETRPGIYVIRVLGRQRDVKPYNQIEGDLPIELSPSAPDALPSVALRLAMSTCGIEYSNCSNSEAPIVTESRRIQVRCEPGRCEFPGIENAKYRLLDDHGVSVAEGTTDHQGIAHLPPKFVGRATLIVAADSLTATVQQSLDLLPAAPGAPNIVATMTSLGSSGKCSVVNLETHATPQ